MKKVIYMAVVAVGFFTASCTKENIRPCTHNSDETPVWRTLTTHGSDENTSTGSGVGSGSITDPNSDPDESSRKRH